MKVREGFVSNSSSSSFCIKRSELTDEQLEMILNHVKVAIERGWTFTDMNDHLDSPDIPCGWPQEWDVHVVDGFVVGYTSMDNFDMREFVRLIGCDPESFSWEKD